MEAAHDRTGLTPDGKFKTGIALGSCSPRQPQLPGFHRKALPRRTYFLHVQTRLRHVR